MRVLLLLLLLPMVSAQEITLSTEHAEYYFLVGQRGEIPIEITNDHAVAIGGQLSYTVTQATNQGGFQAVNSNSQSSVFGVEAGGQTTVFDLGIMNTPTTITLSLVFSYTVIDTYEVRLDNIVVHFVENEQPNSGGQQSSTQSAIQQQQSRSPQQQRMDQLQNNQMSQDSNALKEQLQEQMQEQEALEDAFSQSLQQNQEFQEQEQQLAEEGYAPINEELHPQTEDTGDFEVIYEDADGNQKTLSGSMEDGDITEMRVTDKQDLQDLLDVLETNEEFQSMEQELFNEGFERVGEEITENGVEIMYENGEEEASISAEIEEERVVSLQLEKEEEKNLFWLLFFLILSGFLLYVWYHKEQPLAIPQEAFNYKDAANKLLMRAQESYANKQYKDAFGLVASGVRLFYSYEHKIYTELTNREILSSLKGKEKKDLKSCFTLCSQVEFAKYKPLKKDFNKALKLAKEFINN